MYPAVRVAFEREEEDTVYRHILPGAWRWRTSPYMNDHIMVLNSNLPGSAAVPWRRWFKSKFGHLEGCRRCAYGSAIPELVHRLDRIPLGVLLVAKNAQFSSICIIDAVKKVSEKITTPALVRGRAEVA